MLYCSVIENLLWYAISITTLAITVKVINDNKQNIELNLTADMIKPGFDGRSGLVFLWISPIYYQCW